MKGWKKLAVSASKTGLLITCYCVAVCPLRCRFGYQRLRQPLGFWMLVCSPVFLGRAVLRINVPLEAR